MRYGTVLEDWVFVERVLIVFVLIVGIYPKSVALAHTLEQELTVLALGFL